MADVNTSVAHLPAAYVSMLMQLEPLLQLPLDQVPIPLCIYPHSYRATSLLHIHTQLNLLFVLIAQAVAGSVYARIKSTIIRQTFGMLLGFVLLYAMYGIESLYLLAFIIGMYPIILMKNPRITFWLSMTVLFLAFLYMFMYHYLSWRLDATTSLMGIVVRLHTLTWDLADYDKIRKQENLGNFKRFVAFRQEHACDDKKVGLFVYLSYMLFFVHALMGSNLCINEYLAISDRTIFAKEGWKDKHNDPRPSVMQVVNAAFAVIATAAVFLVGKMYFSLDFLMSLEFQQQYPFWKQFILCPLCSFLCKFKYHFGWKMLDLSLITSGAGFSGVEYASDGKTVIRTKWERANNIWSIKTAFPQYTGHVVRYWNMTVNNWLTFYVFYRIDYVPKLLVKLQGEKGAKVILTRMASALFHGVYPSYYIFFTLTAILTNAIDTLRLILPTYEDEVEYKKQSPYALKSMLLYAFWVCMVVIPIDSVGIMFMELDLFKVIKLYKAVYWFPIWVGVIDIVLGVVLLKVVGIKQIEKEKLAKAKAKKKTQTAKDTKKEN